MSKKLSKEYLIFWNGGKDSILCSGLDIALLKVKELLLHNRNDIVIKQLDNEIKKDKSE